MATKKIEELDQDLQLASEDDVIEIKKYLGKKAEGYDGFFVRVKDGDYDEVWGFENAVPYPGKGKQTSWG